MKKIRCKITIRRLIILLIWLNALFIISCAPRHLKSRVSYADRQKILRESNTNMREIESNHRNMKIKQFLHKIHFYLGTPYKFGGDSRSGMDCSGFVSTVFHENFNIDLPHNAYQIYQACQKLSSNELNLGDLVFFRNSRTRKINHVGIYLVDNYFVHSSLSYGVIISNLRENYYHSRYAGAGRIINLKTAFLDDK
jgi:cell wall-associated NlpC family hydrolase